MNSKLILLCIVLNAYSSLSHRLLYKPLSETLKEVPATNHWALLVAGSNEWSNYRHQADICRAYQILRSHGMPAERIITMMYDDIAYNEFNPRPGVIINELNGPNVYEGVVIDYRGKDVNPKNFLAILRGDEEAMAGIGSGKVIKSGPNDHVFVNFADHGGPGVICFPDDDLYADDLMQTLKEMSAAKKFGQMVMYIEACESGSMFLNLPSNINIYVTTAANEKESSYACTYDESLHAYLGDVYSVNWMDDSSKAIFTQETLKIQYEIVKKLTTTSHVMTYGDLKISEENLEDFQGEDDSVSEPISVRTRSFDDAVPSEDVTLAILNRKLEASGNDMEKMVLQEEIQELTKERKNIEKTLRNIVYKVSARSNLDAKEVLNAMQSPTNFDCYKFSSQLFGKKCFDLRGNGYARKNMRKLVNLCEENVPTEVIARAILEECSN